MAHMAPAAAPESATRERELGSCRSWPNACLRAGYMVPVSHTHTHTKKPVCDTHIMRP